MIGGDEVADALCRQLETSTSCVPGAWTQSRSTMLASVAGVPLSGFNTVTPRGAPVDLDDAADLLDAVAATGLPHCLQVRPADVERVAPIADDRKMRFVDGLPFYVREGATTPVETTDFALRPLLPGEASVHAAVAAAGFGLAREVFETLVTPAMLATDGVQAYVIAEGNVAVATGLRVTLGEATGVINVATLPEVRGRGYALAITARMVADGLAEGARFSYLASTPEGLGVYARLGFAEVERWGCWETL